MERDLEPERVVVVDHPAAAIGEDPALRRSPTERPDDLLDVEAGLDRQDDPFGDAEVGAGQDDLVDGLDRLAGADRADVGDRPAHRRRGPAGRARRRLHRPRRRWSGSRCGRPRCRPRPERRPAGCHAPRGALRSPSSPDGAMVEQSMTSVPGAAPATTPSGPNSTASTSGVSETQMTAMPTPVTASAGDSAGVDAEVGEFRRRDRASGSRP